MCVPIWKAQWTENSYISSPAQYIPPITAPMEQPATQSTGRPRSLKTCSTPIWASRGRRRPGQVRFFFLFPSYVPPWVHIFCSSCCVWGRKGEKGCSVNKHPSEYPRHYYLSFYVFVNSVSCRYNAIRAGRAASLGDGGGAVAVFLLRRGHCWSWGRTERRSGYWGRCWRFWALSPKGAFALAVSLYADTRRGQRRWATLRRGAA